MTDEELATAIQAICDWLNTADGRRQLARLIAKARESPDVGAGPPPVRQAPRLTL